MSFKLPAGRRQCIRQFLWPLFVLIAMTANLRGGSLEFSRLPGDAAKAGYINSANAMVLDGAGNLYVADFACVRKITPAGAISTLAGDAENPGYVDGIGEAARFRRLQGIALDTAGNLFVSDADNNVIRKISSAGAVSTFAGSATSEGSADGKGGAARFWSPAGIVADAEGFLYLADTSNGTIRKISADGTVTTLAGSPGRAAGSADGVGTAARFYSPSSIARDAAGILYVSDEGGATVRKITRDGVVTTLVGPRRDTVDDISTPARVEDITGIAVDKGGNLYVTDSFRNVICKITPGGEVTTIAGQIGLGDLVDGVGGYARFLRPAGVTIDLSGVLFVAENGNRIVRKGVPTSVPSPPIFLQSDRPSNSNLRLGSTISLVVAVESETPVRFQWFKDGVALPGATSDTLELLNVSEADEGTYSIIASNDGGKQTLDLGSVSIYSPPIRSFSAVHTAIGGSFLWSITSGGGSLVAVGTGGTILTSTEGVTWTRADSDTTEWLLGVTWGNSQYIAVGDHGTILTSSDAKTWKSVAQSGTSQRLNNVVYGGGIFVAVGEGGTIVTSADGSTWAAKTSGVVGWLRGLVCIPTWGNGDDGSPGSRFVGNLPKFFAAGQDGRVVGSKDGVVWETQLPFSSSSQDIEALSTDGSLVYAVSANGTVSFKQPIFPSSFLPPPVPIDVEDRIRGFALGAGALFATGENGTVVVAPSVYGPWTPVATNTTVNLVAGTFRDNSLYVVGENETILCSSPLFASRLLNISTRAHASGDTATMISGFVISGETPKQVLLRAIGPGLSRLAALTGSASSPRLKLFNAKGTQIAQNADWRTAPNKSDIIATANRVGAFPLNEADSDSALLTTLTPGAYTAHVDVSGGESGLALVEAYDADQISNGGSKMINISTRASAGMSADTIIAGFVIGGDAARKVLIRGIGPALRARFGISGVLEKPMLTLHNSGGDVLTTAGAWSRQPNSDEIVDSGQRAGAFPLAQGSSDAAIVTTLVPGVYTVSVAGTDNETGIALIEVYDLP